jgi:hypothetical protein
MISLEDMYYYDNPADAFSGRKFMPIGNPFFPRPGGWEKDPRVFLGGRGQS